MTEFTTEFMSGTIYWAKVFKAFDNYERTAKEYSFDFVPDAASIEVLKKHRLLDRLKEPRDPIPDDYIRLRKPELDKDGKLLEKIKILDADGEPWDQLKSGNIGNGSKVDIRLTVADFGKGMKKALWTSAIRVNKLVPHEGGTQSPDPFNDYAKPESPASAPKAAKTKSAPRAEELDDDLPFD